MDKNQSTLFPNILGIPSTQRSPKPSDTLNVLQGLDRGEVELLVAKILCVAKCFCMKAEVAGSFRRGRPVVNDLDVVVQPKVLIGIDSWLEMLKAVRKEFVAFTERQGHKLARLYLPFVSTKQGSGYVQVDFYRADPTTWGVLLLVRTGSKEHNVKLCNLAIQKGLRLQYSVGLTDSEGQVVAGRTEEDVFRALELAFIQPNEREV